MPEIEITSLEQARRAADVSQDVVARAMTIADPNKVICSRNLVKRIETRKVSPTLIQCRVLARLYGIPLDAAHAMALSEEAGPPEPKRRPRHPREGRHGMGGPKPTPS